MKSTVVALLEVNSAHRLKGSRDAGFYCSCGWGMEDDDHEPTMEDITDGYFDSPVEHIAKAAFKAVGLEVA